jgi:hypothetical protein
VAVFINASTVAAPAAVKRQPPAAHPPPTSPSTTLSREFVRRQILTFVAQINPSIEKTSKPPSPFASLYQQTKTIQIRKTK